MQTPAQLAESCLAYYPLKADTLDYSNNANDATAMGSISFIPGRFGQAASIAGVPGNGVQLPAAAFSQTGEDFTLALWVCLSADENITNGWAVIAGGLLGDNDNGSLSYQMTYQLAGQTAVDDFLFNAALTPGVWTHLAVSFDQAQMLLTCYVNGEVTATYANALPAGALALMPFTGTPYIGCAGPSSDQTATFNGAIGDVMLFNLVLDQSTLDLLDGAQTYDLSTPSSDTAFPWGFAALAVVVVGIMLANFISSTRRPKLISQIQSPSAPPPYDPAVVAAKIMQLAAGSSPVLPLAPAQLTRTQANIPDYAKVKVDIGGLGEYLYSPPGVSTVMSCGFKDAINVNCTTTTQNNSTPPNQPIPNLLLIEQTGPMSCNANAKLPLANDTVDYVVMQNTPLTNQWLTEIARVLKPNGEVGLWIDAQYAAQIRQLASSLGFQQMECTDDNADLDEMVLRYQALIDQGVNAVKFLYPKIRLYPAPGASLSVAAAETSVA